MKIGDQKIGRDQNLFFIAGPCAIESYDIAMRTAEKIADISLRNGFLIVYKSSFSKMNRTSFDSFRGLGIDEGLKILQSIKSAFDLKVTTDVHNAEQVIPASEVADVIQIPAFLMRQTDLVEAAARSERLVHFKKAQFASPTEVKEVLEKAKAIPVSKNVPRDRFIIGERGSCFGYNDLVVDMRNLKILGDHCPIVFDASHSSQKPAALGSVSGGDRHFIPLLARAAVAAGVAGIFIETHPKPEDALCDRLTQWPLDKLENLFNDLVRIHLLANSLSVA